MRLTHLGSSVTEAQAWVFYSLTWVFQHGQLSRPYPLVSSSPLSEPAAAGVHQVLLLFDWDSESPWDAVLPSKAWLRAHHQQRWPHSPQLWPWSASLGPRTSMSILSLLRSRPWNWLLQSALSWCFHRVNLEAILLSWSLCKQYGLSSCPRPVPKWPFQEMTNSSWSSSIPGIAGRPFGHPCESSRFLLNHKGSICHEIAYHGRQPCRFRPKSGRLYGILRNGCLPSSILWSC